MVFRGLNYGFWIPEIGGSTTFVKRRWFFLQRTCRIALIQVCKMLATPIMHYPNVNVSLTSNWYNLLNIPWTAGSTQHLAIKTKKFRQTVLQQSAGFFLFIYMLLKCAGFPLDWEENPPHGSELAGCQAFVCSALPCCTCAGNTVWEAAPEGKGKPESSLEMLLWPEPSRWQQLSGVWGKRKRLCAFVS